MRSFTTLLISALCASILAAPIPDKSAYASVEDISDDQIHSLFGNYIFNALELASASALPSTSFPSPGAPSNSVSAVAAAPSPSASAELIHALEASSPDRVDQLIREIESKFSSLDAYLRAKASAAAAAAALASASSHAFGSQSATSTMIPLATPKTAVVSITSVMGPSSSAPAAPVVTAPPAASSAMMTTELATSSYTLPIFEYGN